MHTNIPATRPTNTYDLTRYEDVEIRMSEVVQAHFTDAPFFRYLREGKYSVAQVRYFAVQYSYYSRHFPRVLGAAISAMSPEDDWWIPLADNLWDEAGRGVPGRSHGQLYRTFLCSVDRTLILDDRGYPPTPMSAAVDKAVRTFIDFFRTATELEAMAAVGLGSELFAGEVMGMIGEGFQHANYQKDGPIDVRFWELHSSEHEPHHYQLCKNVLISFADATDLKTMFEVGRSIAKSEAKMYDELHQEMLNLA